MKVLSVVGARPQFVKLAPVAAAVSAAGHEHQSVHTGQHYDPAMSDVFFDDLEIPAPLVDLGIGSASHGAQTGAMLAGLEDVVRQARPDWVLVYGDTNSTLAGALAAVKLHVPVAHLEAGLRSFNRRMPEEHNRVLSDHAADVCLAPTHVALGHLAGEGLGGRSVLVGDVMADVCLRVREATVGRAPVLPPGVDPAAPYLVSTLHRAENTDDPDRLRSVIGALARAPLPVALVAHPRLVARATEFGIDLKGGSVHALPPLGYPEMVRTVAAAWGVVTDSGGLQKEAYLLGTPCTTIRTETEWPETLIDGWNVLCAERQSLAEVLTPLVGRSRPIAARGTPYGDGHAAERVAAELASRCS